MLEQRNYDVLIVGGGPGGYAAGIRAAQSGRSTAIVEGENLGGVCLNRGCMPSKFLLTGAELINAIRDGSRFGIPDMDWTPDYEKAVESRDRTINRARTGLTHLIEGNGVSVINGIGKLRSSHELDVASRNTTETIGFEHLIVATGSRPAKPPIRGIDLPGVVDSDGMLKLTEIPKRTIIVGSGAIGLEWAEILNAYGGDVTILEQMDTILPNEEPKIVKVQERLLRRKDITYNTKAKVLEIYEGVENLKVRANIEDAEQSFDAELVLIATGRTPNTEEIGLDNIGIVFNRSGITTDPHMRTNIDHVFAIGDVTGQTFLAHAASEQGLVAVETIMGNNRTFDGRNVPRVIFTDPEIASVGLMMKDESEVVKEEKGFRLAALGRYIASGRTEGEGWYVYEQGTGKLLGVHIIGQAAGDLIGEACLAIEQGMSVDEISRTMHAHPTRGEFYPELGMAAMGLPLHVPRR